jgi:hypothetical protein
MVALNIFRNDAFSALEMTSAFERLPYLPQTLDSLNIFTPNPIRTTALGVEERDGVLGVIATTERGSPIADERQTERRKVRYFETSRITQGSTIWAHELQNIRAFGTETEFMQVQTEVGRRVAGPTGLLNNVRYTFENMRLAAVKGILVDKDGTTLYNWYDEFEIIPAAVTFFDLASQTANSLRPKINALTRSMYRSAKGAMPPGTRIVALCGDGFWDKFTNHVDVIRTFLNWAAAADLRGDQGGAFSTFKFCDIEWINYRGSDDNSTIKIADEEVQFFPAGAPGIFEHTMAPAETMDFVNTPGKEFYLIPVFDRDRNMWWRVEVYSYPLFICKRPEVLRKGSSAAS